MMASFQVWLVGLLEQQNPVADLMRTAWAWPIMESLHFIGLSLLIGSIGVFDLRLLGIGKRIPIAALHRLVPWGILGWIVSISTGATFLLTDANQYIYNPAFQLKMVAMAILGSNAGMFYLTSYRQILGGNAGMEAPGRAKIIAAISLSLWITVIACGRMITFYRPAECGPAGPGTIAQCVP